MDMYEEIISEICKESFDHCIDEAITRLKKGVDFDDVIDEITESIINDHFKSLRERHYKDIRNILIDVIQGEIFIFDNNKNPDKYE